MSFREVIAMKGFIVYTTKGASMMPLLKEGEDIVKIVKIERPLVKGDVILYENSDKTKNILHRIIKVVNNKDQVKYVLCGDNNVIKEKYIYPKQIIGVMDGYYKGDKYIDIKDKEYIKYYKKRMRTRWLRKIRRTLASIYHTIFKEKAK